MRRSGRWCRRRLCTRAGCDPAADGRRLRPDAAGTVRRFGLSALDAALVVMSMALIGRGYRRRRVVFSGYESKVTA